MKDSKNKSEYEKFMETPGNKENFVAMFDAISIALTPDFSGKDWLELFEKSNKGDLLSQEMLLGLFKSKVNPYLKKGFRLEDFHTHGEK